MMSEKWDESGELKIATRLVERPRDETWWHDIDFYTVPHFKQPAILATKLAVLHKSTLYCLDSQFDYAKDFEVDFNDAIGLNSAPIWYGPEGMAISVLRKDGRYQAIIANLQSGEVMFRTLMRGNKYDQHSLFEDRKPLSPVVCNGHLIFIDPHGHYYNHGTKGTQVSGRLYPKGEDIRIRRQPCLDSFAQIVVQTSDPATQTSRLEWRNPSTMQCLRASDRYRDVWGFTIGYAGSAPQLLTGGNIMCGFGEQLVCFNPKGKVIWQFRYPELDARDPDGGIKVYRHNDTEEEKRELVYASSSEVTINSNILEHGSYLYFVLSEGTRHVNYVVKMDKDSGDVIWTSRIDGYSGSFAISDLSEFGLLLQDDCYFWLVSGDGSQHDELILDLDGTSCSDAVRIAENEYVVNSDLGVHVFNLDSSFMNRS